MPYEPIITPHFDRFIAYNPNPDRIIGFRKDVAGALVGNCPDHKAARSGYLSALYALRMMELPGAYERPESIANFQEAIRLAICRLTEEQA